MDLSMDKFVALAKNHLYGVFHIVLWSLGCYKQATLFSYRGIRIFRKKIKGLYFKRILYFCSL